MLGFCHYFCLKPIACYKYLCITKDWDICFKLTSIQPELDNTKHTNYVTLIDKTLPTFPTDINQSKLLAFVDGAYAQKPWKQYSTAGFVFTHCSGVIVYWSKTHNVVTLISTEAEFITAVIASKFTSYI